MKGNCIQSNNLRKIFYHQTVHNYKACRQHPPHKISLVTSFQALSVYFITIHYSHTQHVIVTIMDISMAPNYHKHRMAHGALNLQQVIYKNHRIWSLQRKKKNSLDETTLPFTGGPQCNSINVDQFGVCLVQKWPIKILVVHAGIRRLFPREPVSSDPHFWASENDSMLCLFLALRCDWAFPTFNIRAQLNALPVFSTRVRLQAFPTFNIKARLKALPVFRTQL